MEPLALIAGLFAALAVAAVAAALRFRAARGRFAQRNARLEAEIETLADRVFELTEMNARHRDLIDAQGDLIVRRDRDGRITFANQAYARLIGRPVADLVGTSTVHAISARSEPQFGSDGTGACDELTDTPEGRRWIAWQHHPMRDGKGGVEEILSVGRDVTDRKAQEAEMERATARAAAANEAKSRFLATVSHEIRTPLNGIMGMADLMLDTELTPEQRAYASAVKSSGDILATLIDDVLDFSKIESGRLDLESQPFDLTLIVEAVAELLAPRAHSKGLELATYIAPSLPRRLIGDATRLKQVLLNLVGNAVKFTDEGGVAIEIEADGARLSIAVRDTGPGIAAADVARIFEEFEQGEAGFARRHAGTGLGLAISRRIVDRMGGRLTVATSPGAGATFTATLPLALAADAEPVNERLDGLAVLIVSASRVETSVLARRLTDLGAIIDHIADPADILTDRDYATALLDRRLGDAALSACLDRLAGRVDRLILLVTPRERADVAAWRKAGINGWLVSPVRETSLLIQVRPHAGSTVSPEPDEALIESQRQRLPAPVSASGLSVLLAEDNEINALLARALLEKLGARVVLARNGEAAFDLWRANPTGFDAILMDMQMPVCDGLEATRRIRAAEAPGPRMPIIALTANAFVEDREAARTAGMDDFITKPLDRERLVEALTLVTRREARPPVPPDRRRASARR